MRARSVAFVTGHNAGGAPGAVDWAALGKGADTIVLYMALARLAAELLAAGRAPDEPVAVLSDATTSRARQRVTTLADATAIRGGLGPTLIVIGSVVGLGALLAPWQQTEPATAAAATDDLSAAQL
jgi:uroporphyrin-III C-methyltransferase